MRKVLIANRGEIAVRIARACKDSGLTSVAVYAEPDLDALHVRMADEAHALTGRTAAESYLDAGKLLKIAKDCGADAVHPGCGFLAERADFAQAVLDAGLTWIGPPPAAITALGDKVRARQVAERVGVPLVAGTAEPVTDVSEVVAFAREHGLPIVIKATFGGGGRGLKVVRTLDEIPERYESAVRESVGAFGHAECFVERFMENQRHVETQCLADAHGNVVVVSTRDCSLQRRHQKLVEEAPAPFLSGTQEDQLRSASKAILRAAGYVGAGTCEFLVGRDGAISFLEVNTRLQVEHPVTEEVTGIDLVREMFRIADGEALSYNDPEPRGHSVEFRITAEDAGRDFLPAVGTLTGWCPPSGPGVRLDSGFDRGDTLPQAFDSMIAKLVVTGATRRQALERSRRALAEFVVAGLPTVLPFHRALLDEPAFVGEPFAVHTRWIETGFEHHIPPYDGEVVVPPAAERETITVEVGGTRVEVGLPGGFGLIPAPARDLPGSRNPGTRPAARRPGAAVAGGDAVVAPMQGTIVKLAAQDGATAAPGDLIVVLEAMKMEQPVTAHKAGTITGLSGVVGETVTGGATICEIRD
ncbi:MAG TPA: biotin carboxylase N-terminal domain-containing protein [Amycolatopsis sp.]|uniref:acetyl/propionyl/methylcrotonyl-CoA carboxylase subunit alpha n=1 Tax=Amycolatopsis sp. TaxID=37632 RepID=UPI002B489DC7|nr:biotin carboxylase N-terminal domain-containing protein [Amycolatopsis sp.]HKS44415.1 biotin carboxylase N-terminal domain-containing protein [Amycolatopsis sp.]